MKQCKDCIYFYQGGRCFANPPIWTGIFWERAEVNEDDIACRFFDDGKRVNIPKIDVYGDAK